MQLGIQHFINNKRILPLENNRASSILSKSINSASISQTTRYHLVAHYDRDDRAVGRVEERFFERLAIISRKGGWQKKVHASNT